MYILYIAYVYRRDGLYQNDLELVGLQQVLEGKCLKAVLRQFYFDFSKYHVNKDGLCFSFEHYDYNSKNIIHIIYYSNNYLLYSHTITYSIRNNQHSLHIFVIIFIYFRIFTIISNILQFSLLIIYIVISGGEGSGEYAIVNQ